MKDFLEALHGHLVVSCQPVRGGPLDTEDVVARTVQAVIEAGASGVRLEGERDLRVAAQWPTIPVVGLVKRDAEPGEAIITARRSDLDVILRSAAAIVAFEATARKSELVVADAVAAIHAEGRLAMADVSTFAEGMAAWDAGADLVGTTLSGYTPHSRNAPGPDLDLVETLAQAGVRVMAEGRFHQPADAAAALRRGAFSVTVGSAITRPEHVTAWFLDAIDHAARA